MSMDWRGVTDWRGAMLLVGRLSVGLGVVLVVLGLAKVALLAMQTVRSRETIATIEAATRRQIGSGGSVDLSWQDAEGVTYRAGGVQISNELGRKLRLGSRLARANLKIRYQPKSQRPSVLVVEDLPEHIRSAAALAIAGFLAVSAGSALILAIMLSGNGDGRVSPWRLTLLEPGNDKRR